MFYLCFTVCTDPSHPEHKAIDQAFVSCWLKRETRQEAIDDATALIQEEPWLIESLDEVFETERDEWLEESDVLEYFDEAYNEGAALMFNVCPRSPLYFVQFDVSRGTDGHIEHANAAVWVSNVEVLESASDATIVADFWTCLRIETALKIARQVLAKAGWSAGVVIKQWPFSYRSLEAQPELESYYDAAEEDGVAWAIWSTKTTQRYKRMYRAKQGRQTAGD